MTNIESNIDGLENTMGEIIISESCIRANETEGYVQLYYDGIWNNWVKFTSTEDDLYNKYVYYKGTDYTDITGGWSGYAYKSSTSSASTLKAPTITMGSSYMTIKITYGSNTVGSAITGYMIDLTDYNYIEINYTTTLGNSSGSVNFRLISTKQNKYVDQGNISIKSTSNTTATLDISSKTGSYYFCVSLYYSQVKIYSIKLVR